MIAEASYRNITGGSKKSQGVVTGVAHLTASFSFYELRIVIASRHTLPL